VQDTYEKICSDSIPFFRSYGGYASAMALATQNSSVFKCAASVAPVTDWTYYGENLKKNKCKK
jgi:hypothetical protein